MGLSEENYTYPEAYRNLAFAGVAKVHHMAEAVLFLKRTKMQPSPGQSPEDAAKRGAFLEIAIKIIEAATEKEMNDVVLLWQTYRKRTT
jgi:hypothetical protein